MVLQWDPLVRDQVSRLMGMLRQLAIAKNTTRPLVHQAAEDATKIADKNAGREWLRRLQNALVDLVDILGSAPAHVRFPSNRERA